VGLRRGIDGGGSLHTEGYLVPFYDGDVSIRAGGPGDRPFLEAMLREATYPNDPAVSVADVMGRPDLAMTIPDFSRSGDLAQIAEDAGTPVGAAWCRRFTESEHSWGFMDEDTPEVGLAVLATHRGQGIGTALLTALAGAARTAGSDSLSLCTERDGAARSLYERLGFVDVGALADDPDAILMRLDLVGLRVDPLV
jgi:GNAT superfamily N-acetyltransferase